MDANYYPQDFLKAEQIVDYLLQNRAIEFQIKGEQMNRESAVRHFSERKALIMVKQMLLDECERAMKPK